MLGRPAGAQDAGAVGEHGKDREHGAGPARPLLTTARARR